MPPSRLASLVLAGLSIASTSIAQTTTQTTSTTPTDVRPATTTFFGDTGLWFVPTAEVLAEGKWSGSAYRRGTNYVQGFTNIGDIAGTAAYGLKNRAEVFTSFLLDTRVERDLRPIFLADGTVGGIVDRYPRANSGWSGNQVGDWYVGAKVNLLSEARGKAVAVAVRAMLKLPTGDDAAGASTGQADFLVDAIASKEVRGRIDVSGYAGYEGRGAPDGIDIPGGAFRWGIGTGVPSRGRLRGQLELTGVVPSSDTATITGAPIIGSDLTVAPLVSSTEKLTRLTTAVTWQAPKGFFIGGGLSWNFPTKDRDQYRTDEGAFGDFVDWQIRVGFHPGSTGGAGRIVRAAPAPPPPPPAPVAPQNRPPTVTAQCDPCTVEPGGRLTLTAVGNDPDGDMLTYRWTVPQGTLATPGAAQTGWTAPAQEGSVQATVTVDDGKGGTASATVTVQVVRPPVRNYTFEDVHFDFDRYTLRPEATRVLDEAVAAMRDNATLRLEIEGHTCNIGTAEYNLALGDRRATAVREYLVSRGVTADRLRTISYGEERPKYDNAREETRRLNRRAALVVNLR